jgi:hypothetical protein
VLGFQVTLTLADTNYHLIDLVRDIDSSFLDVANKVSLQTDDENSGTILIGDVNLSATRFGAELNVTDSMAVGHSVRGVYARSASAGQKLNIAIER